jgi:EAL and modified HD-GYP domain-containing signal transduction protein
MFSFLDTLFGRKSASGAEGPNARPSESTRTHVTEPAAGSDHSFVCREPILNRGHRIAGYEFLLHQGLQRRISSGNSAVLRRAYDDALICNLGSASVGSPLGDRLAFVRISPESLSNPQLSTLPPGNTVLMLDPADGAGAEMAGWHDRVLAVRDSGYRIGCLLRPDVPSETLLPLCDFVLVSTPAYDGLGIADAVRRLRKLETPAPLSLIAADIETPDDFHVCFRAGFDYFHGPFVNHRENWHPPRGNVDRALIAHVLTQLRRGMENAELAKTIRQDAVITYKLLRYINSPFNGLSREITTIEQCLQLLGRDRFYRWVSLLLFDVQKPGYVERVLTEQALVRASLMERMGQRSGGDQPNPDQLFLTGLFSLLDKLLDRPLAEIVASVSVAKDVGDALIAGTGPLARYLKLAVACESGHQEEIAAAAAACQLDVDGVNHDLMAALVWADEVAKVET